jgi:hypothetical protein
MAFWVRKCTLPFSEQHGCTLSRPYTTLFCPWPSRDRTECVDMGPREALDMLQMSEGRTSIRPPDTPAGQHDDIGQGMIV